VKVRTHGAAQTRALAGALAELLRAGDVVVLAGPLGSGKTVFAQGVAAGLGVVEPVVSPTFTIVREYEGRLPVVHVDVYRLDRLQELHDVGFDELVGGEAVTLIEWGDVLETVLPSDRLEVQLEPAVDAADPLGALDDERLVTLVALGPSWQRRAPSVAAVLERFELVSGEGTT